MNKVYSKEMRTAMERLLQHYEKQLRGELSILSTCPLCSASKGESCSDCWWVINTGKGCYATSSKWSPNILRTGAEFIPKQTLTKWRKRRIKELRATLGRS